MRLVLYGLPGSRTQTGIDADGFAWTEDESGRWVASGIYTSDDLRREANEVLDGVEPLYGDALVGPIAGIPVELSSDVEPGTLEIRRDGATVARIRLGEQP